MDVSITTQDMEQLINEDGNVRLKAENVALRRRIAELEAQVSQLAMAAQENGNKKAKAK